MPSLKLASWNLEWLIAPEQFKLLREHCVSPNDTRPRSERAIPCDVAYRLERSGSDYAALALYAKQLNADVIALQEVDGASAARLIFPGYDFCFTARAHPQNNGFAVRRGIPHRCERDLLGISAGDTLRRGAIMTLYPGESRETTLMSVHLKSGCARGALHATRVKACRELAGQLPALAKWIRAERAAHHRFALVGDLNRELAAEKVARSGSDTVAFSAALGTAPEAPALMYDASDGASFRNCFPGQMHTAFIDFILLDERLALARIPGSFEHLTYRVSDAHRRKLSDHCPVAVRLEMGGPAFD